MRSLRSLSLRDYWCFAAVRHIFFIEAAVYIGMCYKGKVHVIKTHPFRNSIILAVVMVMLSVTGTWLYNMKKDSSDGRILIWKLSAGMLADRPQGYGYGLFEKYYNLRQAEYFSKNDASSMEKRNAVLYNIDHTIICDHYIVFENDFYRDF